MAKLSNTSNDNKCSISIAWSLFKIQGLILHGHLFGLHAAQLYAQFNTVLIVTLIVAEFSMKKVGIQPLLILFPDFKTICSFSCKPEETEKHW